MIQTFLTVKKLFPVAIVLLISFSCSDDEATESLGNSKLTISINSESFQAKSVEAIAYREARLEIKAVLADDAEVMIELVTPNDNDEFLIDGETDDFGLNNEISYAKESDSYRSLYNDAAKGSILTYIDREQNKISGSLDYISLDENLIITDLTFTDIEIIQYYENEESLGSYYLSCDLAEEALLINTTNEHSVKYSNYGSLGQNNLYYSDFIWHKSSFYGNSEVIIRFIIKEEPALSNYVLGSFMQTGSIPFGSLDEVPEDHIEGVVILYTDQNGVLWSSDLGESNQTGSFEITNRIDDQYGFSAQIQGEFTCILHDGAGNSIDLTNAEYSANAIFFY